LAKDGFAGLECAVPQQMCYVYDVRQRGALDVENNGARSIVLLLDGDAARLSQKRGISR
jgi:hypothetical protein